MAVNDELGSLRRGLAAGLRALKPGGMFFSYDPLTYNPLINVYRRMATAVRTTDEAPLTVADIRLGHGLERLDHRVRHLGITQHAAGRDGMRRT